MPKVRYGVALVIPSPVDREIDVLRRSLSDGALGRIMPHLTLVPPVNVPIDQTDECLNILREAALKTNPFTATLGPAATFSPTNPVVFLHASPSEELLHLRGAVSKGPLAKESDHEFVPHVTICDHASEDEIAAAVLSLRGYSADVTFDRVHLLQKDTGEPWRVVADFTFGAERTIGTGGLVVNVATASTINAEVASFLEREWKPWLNTNLGPNREEFEPVVITARREGEVVGVLRAEFRPPSGHMRELLIAASARGQGIARYLLNEFDLVAQQRGATRLTTNILHGCEAEGYMRHVGWRDDNESIVNEFNREMVRLTRSL